jgi:hypothetical protein
MSRDNGRGDLLAELDRLVDALAAAGRCNARLNLTEEQLAVVRPSATKDATGLRYRGHEIAVTGGARRALGA